MRILIIDDDQHIRCVLKEALVIAGYEVAVAENGLVGMRMQRENPADLVVTDLMMPEVEGIETIRHLRREFSAVRIIAISGGGRIGSAGYLPAARELGANRIFSKPFDMRAFINAVDILLKNEKS